MTVPSGSEKTCFALKATPHNIEGNVMNSGEKQEYECAMKFPNEIIRLMYIDDFYVKGDENEK